jgi:hypothetical protein
MSNKQNQSIVKNNKTKNKLIECDQKIETETAGKHGQIRNKWKLNSDNTSIQKKEIQRNKSKLITSEESEILESDTSLEYSSPDEEINADIIRDSSTEQINQKRTSTSLSSAWKQIFSWEKIDKREIAKRNATEYHTNFQQAHLINADRQELHIVFGNNIKTHDNYECFLFHNINGIKDDSNWSQILLAMKDLDITCFGFVELNTIMKGVNFCRWQEIIHKLFNSRQQRRRAILKWNQATNREVP